jgi:arylsulfatase A-like enzyme
LQPVFLRLLSLVAACLPLGSLAAQTPPNLLIVVADDLGRESVGCYGGANAVATPTIDTLAANGVRFDRAYATPVCAPTRAALQTGRYGFRTGIWTGIGAQSPGLSLDETTLPEALAVTPYARALIGKWNLGMQLGDQTPNLAGWPHFAGALDAFVSDYYSWPRVEDGVASTSTTYVTTAQVDDALAWIGQQTQPWTLMLCFNAPHAPFQEPPLGLHTQDLTGLDPATDPRPFYRAMVEAMDSELGRLLAGLGAAQADTNIVLLSDNGMAREVLDPGIDPNRAKGSLYEEGICVPMIIAGPAVTNPGRTCSELVSVVDLFPTALELCGTSVAAAVPTGTVIDGVSLLPLLQGVAGPVRPWVYTGVVGTGLGDGESMQTTDFKLLRFLGGGTWQHEELYDLRTDPLETTDLLTQTTTPIEMTRVQLQLDLDQLVQRGYTLREGNGCPGSLGIPDQETPFPPTIGEVFPIVPVGGAAAPAVCFTVFGWSNLFAGALPLPLDLDSYGLPGCALAISPDLILSFGPVETPIFLPLPADPVFLWVQFHLQTLVVDPSANAAGLVVSYPLFCTVGH